MQLKYRIHFVFHYLLFRVLIQTEHQNPQVCYATAMVIAGRENNVLGNTG